MSREQDRIRKKLFLMFASVKDPSHPSYTKYFARVMLGTMYHKSIAGISSMQEMTRAFNDERICRSLYTFMGEYAKDYMPHGVTENEFLKRLDSEELDEEYQKKNEHDLNQCYNRGKDNEYVKYHKSILKAKIYFGENLVCSIASETIENLDEYKNQSDEAVKQDCESKAFVRFSSKIKQKFPRQLIIITADGLYVTRTVLQICKDYH